MTIDDVRKAMGLGEGPRTVLVVEDDHFHLARMIAWLRREGHCAIGLVEITEVGEVIRGLDERGDDVALALAEVEAAFLDFYFPRAPFNGGTLTKALVLFGVRVFGMSSVAGKNAEMIRQGAVLGLVKRDLASLL